MSACGKWVQQRQEEERSGSPGMLQEMKKCQDALSGELEFSVRPGPV